MSADYVDPSLWGLSDPAEDGTNQARALDHGTFILDPAHEPRSFQEEACGSIVPAQLQVLAEHCCCWTSIPLTVLLQLLCQDSTVREAMLEALGVPNLQTQLSEAHHAVTTLQRQLLAAEAARAELADKVNTAGKIGVRWSLTADGLEARINETDLRDALKRLTDFHNAVCKLVNGR